MGKPAMDAKTTNRSAYPLPEKLQDELFDNAMDLMVVLDAANCVVRANKPFLTLLGYSLPEIAGQTLAVLIHSDDRHSVENLLEQLKTGDASRGIVLRFVTAEGKSVRCDFTLYPSVHGPYLLAVGHNLDAWYQNCNCICKEANELERIIEERTRELQLANAEMEAFSFSISHDLRAPLRAIRGFSTALTETYGDELGEMGRDYLQRILSNCQRMTTLTDYLLQLARMSRQELRNTTVDLGVMADTIIDDLHAVEPERNVSFKRQGDMTVQGDRELLFTLLQNLLDNAWKYTAKRTSAEIIFLAQDMNGERVFSVIDNGVGYPDACQGRLFRLFQRLHDPSEYQGLGIGLPTAQRIVQRHNGRLWSECIEGERTSFHFTLNGRP